MAVEQANADLSGSRKRKKFIYDPKAEEQFPDVPWYALEHESVIAMVEKICDSLKDPLYKFCPDVEGIEDLIKSAKAAKQLPDIKQFCLAVLGEQGVGKSSLVNALLDRDLLDNSGSSQACTALATKIVHKKGASDHTRKSDVWIDFFDMEEIKECIHGQIQRWTDMHPGPGAEKEENDDEEETDEEAATQDTYLVSKGPKMTTKAKRKAATTAKDFFQIIFNVEKDAKIKRWLRDELYTTDIGAGDFAEKCCRQASARLGQIRKELGKQDGIVRFEDVLDRNLPATQDVAKKIWPFVKLITIATGHVLLRHGLCLFDLPGYGDTSHLRSAVINRYRRKADFEMVVVPSSRVATSETHDRYLDLSLHIKGASKMMVVMNKSDALINENNMFRQIKQIEDEPFISFSERFESYHEIADELEDDEFMDEESSEEMTKLVNEVTVAYIEHETDLFRTQLREKGITEVFSVAAMVYSTWKNRSRREDPVLTAEQSGIPALRRFLFLLPAKRNHIDYYEHVFETLPALRTKAGCVAEKHVEDKTYAEMRHNFKQTVPVLEQELRDLSISQVETFMAKPWLPSEREEISKDIRLLIWRDWIHSKIHFGGFAKMVRERGIPVNGKYSGRNLNADLATTMATYMETWYKDMLPRIEQLAQRLDQPTLDLLVKIASNIDATEADPDLKFRALGALEDARRRITTARNTLLIELEAALRDTRVHFTTEIDVLCPIAKTMKTVFEKAQNVHSGAGVYERQRLSIANATTPDPEDHKSAPDVPLVKKIEDKVVKRLKKAWNTCCSIYITEVIAQLNGFSTTTERLLVNDAYLTEEHRKARQELKVLLVQFDKGLKEVQRKFTGDKEEPLEKKVKFEGCDDDDDDDDDDEVLPKLEEEENGILGEEEVPATAQPRVEPEEVVVQDGEVVSSAVRLELEPGEAVVPIQLMPGWFHATFGGLG